jgi:hypothetical protein
METKKNRPRAVITYHDDPNSITLAGEVEPTLFPEIRLHGTVEPLVVPNVPRARKRSRAADGLVRRHLPASGEALRSLKGEFVVQVFDQGEPGSSREEITGDSFSIELIGGAYNGYTPGAAISRAATSRWSRRSSSPKLQALITSTDGLDVKSESGSSMRSR